MPLDMSEKDLAARGGSIVRKTELKIRDRAVFALGKAERVLSSDCPFCKITAIAVRDIQRVVGWQDLKDLFRQAGKRSKARCAAAMPCHRE